ncbi:MAG TPA: vanadium-dependent haloperoxidase, partial [Albitalea sp.]|nr:vanadium-dependent haloperoxidase [Albitalea sp.]
VLDAAADTPGGVSPMEESRTYAMAFSAAHDALNAIDHRYRPYLSDLNAPGANADAAVASAVSTVLKATLPSQATALDAAYAAALARLPEGSAKAAGVTLGQQTAQAILAARVGDGAADAQGPYVPAQTPGAYQFTPPFDFAAFVNWGAVTPFAMASGSQFRTAAPFALTDAGYTEDFNEVKTLGDANSTTRTPDQTQIARFWLENTPMSWQRIAMKLAASRRLNGWDQMRLYAVLQVAEADAYVASFDSKYLYRFWRPITAIRGAADDGNPDTAADTAWTSLEPAPPIPDHASGHAAAAGAGAAVLDSVFTAPVTFSHQSATLPGVTRDFVSIGQAEQEIGASRVYLGFHFRRAVSQGLKQGRQVGNWAVQHVMGPM